MWPDAGSRWYARGDKLIITHPEGALVLAGWPRCLAWRRDASKPWKQFRPKEPILRIVGAAASPGFVKHALSRSATREPQEPADADLERLRAGLMRRHEAAVSFLALFPPEVRAEVTHLPERHWPVLALLARCPGARELYASNPGLAFALAASSSLRERPVARPLEAARSLLRRPRTAILQWLGFPPARWVERVLAKIAPRALSVRTLRHVRATLRAGSVPKALFHLPRLDRGVLRILTDPELSELASFTLLAEIDRTPSQSLTIAYRLRAAARLHVALHDGRRLSVQRSLAGLERVYDELAARQDRQEEQALLALGLPPPPVAGTESIVPLATPADILDEARSMGHCVFSYVTAVARGSTYLYRLLEPERATLSLVKHGDVWEVDELCGPRNRAVAETTWQAVVDWLGQAAPGAVAASKAARMTSGQS